MTAVTICSDFGDPKNKVWHCFHCFPIYFPWSDGSRCPFHTPVSEVHLLKPIQWTLLWVSKYPDPGGRFSLRSVSYCRVSVVRHSSSGALTLTPGTSHSWSLLTPSLLTSSICFYICQCFSGLNLSSLFLFLSTVSLIDFIHSHHFSFHLQSDDIQMISLPSARLLTFRILSPTALFPAGYLISVSQKYFRISISALLTPALSLLLILLPKTEHHTAVTLVFSTHYCLCLGLFCLWPELSW